jgi:hypothetical protein
MKDFVRKYCLILLVLIGSIAAHAQGVQYVQKNSSVTYTVHNLNGVASEYHWSVTSPSIILDSSTDSAKLVKWTGADGDIDTLTVVPQATDGCWGDSKSLIVHVYSTINELPMSVMWGATPDSLCPAVNGNGVLVNIPVTITSTDTTLDSCKLFYTLDNDSAITYPVKIAIGKGSVTLTFTDPVFNVSGKVAISHQVSIVKVVSGNVSQVYKNGQVAVNVVVKATHSISEIQF